MMDTETDAWAKFTTAELRAKRVALQKLIDSGMLTERSADQQRMEIAFIGMELTRRDGA